MHAKNRSVAVHATLIVEMPHYAFARYRENTRNRIERERDRKNGTRDKKNSSQITAITFVCNFIINEESKNDITYECGKEFREKLKFFQFVYPLSNSIFIRQRDRV